MDTTNLIWKAWPSGGHVLVDDKNVVHGAVRPYRLHNGIWQAKVILGPALVGKSTLCTSKVAAEMYVIETLTNLNKENKKMSTEPEQPETDTETEIEVEASEQAPLDALIRAAAIAKQVFGTADVYATGEIADYLGEDPTEKAKKEFAADLQRSYDYAGVVFEVEKPTAEQVFFILERVIL